MNTLLNVLLGFVKEALRAPVVHQHIELTGTSFTSIGDAVDKAIKRAHKTIKNLCWFQVIETPGKIRWQIFLQYG